MYFAVQPWPVTDTDPGDSQINRKDHLDTYLDPIQYTGLGAVHSYGDSIVSEECRKHCNMWYIYTTVQKYYVDKVIIL